MSYCLLGITVFRLFMAYDILIGVGQNMFIGFIEFLKFHS
jgi:hypothetical protein